MYSCPIVSYNHQGCQEAFGAQGKFLKWGPCAVDITFVNLLHMDFNVELSL